MGWRMRQNVGLLLLQHHKMVGPGRPFGKGQRVSLLHLCEVDLTRAATQLQMQLQILQMTSPSSNGNDTRPRARHGVLWYCGTISEAGYFILLQPPTELIYNTFVWELQTVLHPRHLGYDVTFVRNVTDIEPWPKDVQMSRCPSHEPRSKKRKAWPDWKHDLDPLLCSGWQDHQEKSGDWWDCPLTHFATQTLIRI